MLPARRRGRYIDRLYVGLLLAAVATLGGCRAEIWVRLEIDRKGSTNVSVALYVDDETTEASRKIAGRPLLSLLDIEPLTSTGWSVQVPAPPASRPAWARESLVASKRVDGPHDLSPTMGSFILGGTQLFEGLALQVRDRPHKVSYRLSGRMHLPALDELLGHAPKALTEAAWIAATDRATPPLQLVLAAAAPGRVTAPDAEHLEGVPVWRVQPGEQQKVLLESEILKTHRLGLWSLSSVLVAVSAGFYIAARRRRESTSLSK